MIGPKERLSRREGVNLFVKGARSISQKEAWGRRQTQPGQHGERPSKMTGYARHLREKQKVKRLYGMRETQFRNVYELAVKIAKNTKQDKGHLMLQLLERRLDNVVYIAQLAKSKGAARQMVSHRHIFVNGKRLTIPSAMVNIGDVIEVKPEMYEKMKPDYKGLAVPAWVSSEDGKALVNAFPSRTQIDPSIKESLIVELYSR